MANTFLEGKVASMTLSDWLDDLTVRFLLNLPHAEMSSMPRLCFQVEEAQWFYEDFVRPANPQLPSLNLRQFCLTLFRHSPLLSGFSEAEHTAAYEGFLAYKVRVPVRGAILMDESMEKVLLVRGWKKGATWSFPRGKINRDEKDLDCAIREVYEETGYDLTATGLIAKNEESGTVKSIDVTMREQNMRLFVIRGVPLDTHFEPRTRREIGKIDWYNVKDLPGFRKNKGQGQGHHGQGDAQTSKFYMVAPFLPQLKKWISREKPKKGTTASAHHHSHSLSASNVGYASAMTEDEGEIELDATPEPAVSSETQSTDALKKLLSIGASPVAADPLSLQSSESRNQEQTANLLAMLRGGARPNQDVDAWQNLAEALPTQAPPDSRQTASNQNQQQSAFSSTPQEHIIREMYKQTSTRPGQLGGARQHGNPQYTVHQAPGSLTATAHGLAPASIRTMGSLPQTPFDQIDSPFPQQQPSAPHPHHPRNPSASQTQHLPHSFPPIASQFHQQLPHLNSPHPPSSQFGPPLIHGLHPQDSQHPYRQEQSMQATNWSVPLNTFELSSEKQDQPHTSQHIHTGSKPGDRFSNADLLQSLASQMAQTSIRQPNGSSQPRNLPVAQPTQGQKGPIASGPAIPEASKLPTPNLNPHASSLLDALKGTSAARPSSSGQSVVNAAGLRSASQHQNALLSLFNKSPNATIPTPVQRQGNEEETGSVPASPALTDVTEKPQPPKAPKRKTTLNEITRTLPKARADSTLPTSPPSAPNPAPQTRQAPTAPQPSPQGQPEATLSVTQRQAPVNLQAANGAPERPKSRGQLYDPSKPRKPGVPQASPQLKLDSLPSAGGSLTASQRPKHPPRSSRASSKELAAENGQPVRQYSILQRPGSSAGRVSNPQSPLRYETSATSFQPQVLKRPAGDAVATTSQKPSSIDSAASASDEKKDHLLSLFGKTSVSAPVPAQVKPASPKQEQEVKTKSDPALQKDKLLGLFAATSTPPTIITKSPEPPITPHLVPEQRSTSAQSRSGSANSQQTLLNLFNNNAALSSTNSNASPGTPISPFALGTPATRFPPALKQHTNAFATSPEESRSRLGSLQGSALLGGGVMGPAGGRQTPTSATPTEAKDFLLGYLNGVVKKEGRK